MKMKLHIVEKFYYEVEIDNAEDYEDAKEKFYDNQQQIMKKQLPDRSNWNDYAVEVYDRDWCE
tara:strand:- start:967 stop:1155 length:189 start_codon:yes stop_codon:yes gene_type:complete